jgi:type II secretory pathway pseudopilin PulG
MVRLRRDRWFSERGATLVEASVYIAVLAIIGIPLTMVTLTVSRASAQGTVISKIQERNRVVIQRLIEDYRPSLAGTTTIAPDGKVLRFSAFGGFQGDEALPGAWIRYEIRPDPEGTADEAILVRVNETTGEEIILTNSLRLGSTFTPSGSGVIVDFTTFGYSQGSSLVTDVRRNITIQPHN